MAVSFKTAPTVYYLSNSSPLQFLKQLSKISINFQHLEEFLTFLIIKHKVTETTDCDLNISYFVDSEVSQQIKSEKIVYLSFVLLSSSEAFTFLSNA